MEYKFIITLKDQKQAKMAQDVFFKNEYYWYGHGAYIEYDINNIGANFNKRLFRDFDLTLKDYKDVPKYTFEEFFPFAETKLWKILNE